MSEIWLIPLVFSVASILTVTIFQIGIWFSRRNHSETVITLIHGGIVTAFFIMWPAIILWAAVRLTT